jgi:hypothetical protein
MSGRFYIYLRRSRSDGENSTAEEVLARHCRILQEHAEAALGGRIPEERIFREIVSGETIQDRPEMKRLLSVVLGGGADGVLAADPQRLSRGDLSDCGAVIRAFRYSDTLIVTPSKTYDLSDKFDRKFFEAELMRGSDYLDYIKEIMLRGRLASVREGNFIGSAAPFGYDRVRDGRTFTLVPNSEAETVRLIFDLWTREGLSLAALAERLNELRIRPRRSVKWSSASLREILRNPVYTGMIRWNRRKTVRRFNGCELVQTRPVAPEAEQILVPGRHVPIVSGEVFRTSLARFGSFPRRHTSAALANSLAGIIRCSCGRTMVYQRQRSGAARLHCSGQAECGCKSAPFADVEAAVLEALCRFAEDVSPEPDTAELSPVSALPALESELERLRRRQERLYELLEEGVYSPEVFAARSGELSARAAELNGSISRVGAAPLPDCGTLSLEQALRLAQEGKLSAERLNMLLKTVVSRIVYSRQRNKKNEPFRLDIFLRIS